MRHRVVREKRTLEEILKGPSASISETPPGTPLEHFGRQLNEAWTSLLELGEEGLDKIGELKKARPELEAWLETAEKEIPRIDPEILQLIDRLGDDDPKARDRAHNQLKAIGRPALSYLRQSPRSNRGSSVRPEAAVL